MQNFLDKFHQAKKYTAQIGSHQSELRREDTLTDQKYFYISSLLSDYLNLDSSPGSGGKSERANLVQKNTLFAEVLTILQKNTSK